LDLLHRAANIRLIQSLSRSLAVFWVSDVFRSNIRHCRPLPHAVTTVIRLGPWNLARSPTLGTCQILLWQLCSLQAREIPLCTLQAHHSSEFSMRLWRTSSGSETSQRPVCALMLRSRCKMVSSTVYTRSLHNVPACSVVGLCKPHRLTDSDRHFTHNRVGFTAGIPLSLSNFI
jgi:hypothetical protein